MNNSLHYRSINSISVALIVLEGGLVYRYGFVYTNVTRCSNRNKLFTEVFGDTWITKDFLPLQTDTACLTGEEVFNDTLNCVSARLFFSFSFFSCNEQTMFCSIEEMGGDFFIL